MAQWLRRHWPSQSDKISHNFPRGTCYNRLIFISFTWIRSMCMKEEIRIASFGVHTQAGEKCLILDIVHSVSTINWAYLIFPQTIDFVKIYRWCNTHLVYQYIFAIHKVRTMSLATVITAVTLKAIYLIWITAFSL